MVVISAETKMMGLPYGEEIVIVGRRIWHIPRVRQTGRRADRQTDRQAGRRLDSAPSANVVAMATKMAPWSSPLVGPSISCLSGMQADL